MQQEEKDKRKMLRALNKIFKCHVSIEDDIDIHDFDGTTRIISNIKVYVSNDLFKEYTGSLFSKSFKTLKGLDSYLDKKIPSYKRVIKPKTNKK